MTTPSNPAGLAAEVREKHCRVTQMVSNLDWKQLDVQILSHDKTHPLSCTSVTIRLEKIMSSSGCFILFCSKLSSTAPLPWASSLRSFATLTRSNIPIFSSHPGPDIMCTTRTATSSSHTATANQDLKLCPGTAHDPILVCTHHCPSQTPETLPSSEQYQSHPAAQTQHRRSASSATCRKAFNLCQVLSQFFRTGRRGKDMSTHLIP